MLWITAIYLWYTDQPNTPVQIFNSGQEICYCPKGIDICQTTVVMPNLIVKGQNQQLKHFGTATGNMPLATLLSN